MEHRLLAERRVFVRALVIVIAALPAFAQETQVFLRNGDRLTGVIVAESPQQITLSNAALGRFSLPAAQVERRVAVAPVVTAAATNLPPTPPVPATAALSPALARRQDELTTAFADGRISAAQLHRRRQALLAEAGAGSIAGAGPKPAAVSKLTGEVQAGMDLGFATKDRQLYAGRMKLNHSHGRLRNAADYSFTYGRTDGEVSADRMEGRLKTDYDLTPRIYAYNLGVAGYDEIRKLENYFQVGPGAGQRLLIFTNLSLNFEAGANFQREIRTDGTETDTFYYRLAQEARLNLGPKLTLDQKLEYFPQMSDTSEYKLRFEANVKYWLNSYLFMNLSVIDLYDTMTARGVEPNDLQLRSTIGLRF